LAAADSAALRLDGVTKRFPGVLANDRISFDVRPGEVLGLLGENGAGKTTLMNIVYGLYQPDEGRIEVGGEPVEIRGPQHAVELGIGMVHQHFMLVPDMTVAENVALGPSGLPGLSRLPEVGHRLEELARQFGFHVQPDAVIENLTLGARQRVEILKMLYRGADLLILDEPTAALTPPEWADLSVFLRSMADQGKAEIFITHKLDEILGVADRCTVLRDGAVVGTVSVSETDKPALARMMVGREVALRVDRPRVAPGRPVLEVRDLGLIEDGGMLLQDIDFDLRAGEVFGVAGVGGNGQNELLETLVGLRRPTSGEITIDGEPFAAADTREFTARRGAVIPEDRHHEAVALNLSLLDNLMMKDFSRPPFSQRGVLDLAKAREHCRRLVSEFEIRTSSLDAPMSQLSGGNQQKAVLARELSRDPRLVVAAQPTRGLDVGAMEFVYGRLNDAKCAGAAVLLFSIELDEILSLSDRIAVMVGGRILRILDADEADPETVGLLMAGEEVPA
jgi:simple sugar transport system ATP-binding protein